MAEMAWAFEGRLLVAANTKASVPVAEWDAFLGELALQAQKHWSNEPPRILVFTEGGGPDALQRKALLEQVPQIRSAKGAVISSNALVRGVATAFSWFTSGFRVFHPDDLAQGLEWLELRPGESAAMAGAMARVRRELGDRVRGLPRAM